MGFEFDAISAAMAAVGGPRRAEVLELVLGGSGAAQARRIGGPAQSQRARRGTRASNPRGRFRQPALPTISPHAVAVRRTLVVKRPLRFLVQLHLSIPVCQTVLFLVPTRHLNPRFWLMVRWASGITGTESVLFCKSISAFPASKVSKWKP
jgi:hypothetical protein